MELQPGKFAFLARERLAALQQEQDDKREGKFDASHQGKLLGADFFLTGELRGVSQAWQGGQSDYVDFHFELIDATTSVEVWTKSYEIRKIGRWSDVYQ